MEYTTTHKACGPQFAYLYTQRNRLQYSGAKMAAGESSKRHPYIRETCVGGEEDDSDMGISVKRALEVKVGKQIMECCRDVEEVGKEQRPLRWLSAEGLGRERGKECGKDCGERRGVMPEVEIRRILSMERRSLYQGRGWDWKFVVANDYDRETYLWRQRLRRGAHSTWCSY